MEKEKKEERKDHFVTADDPLLLIKGKQRRTVPKEVGSRRSSPFRYINFISVALLNAFTLPNSLDSRAGKRSRGECDSSRLG